MERTSFCKAASPAGVDERIRGLYLRALSREPEPAEAERMKAYIAKQAEVLGISEAAAADDLRVWTELCHVVYMLKEFIFIG